MKSGLQRYLQPGSIRSIHEFRLQKEVSRSEEKEHLIRSCLGNQSG